MSAPLKDPVRVAAGRSGARKRWGPPRVLRLDTLTPQQRRLVLALLDAAKADESEQAAA